MTPRAYCGDACRARTRYSKLQPDGCPRTYGIETRNGPASARALCSNHARCIRADRVRLARIGACIGCGVTLRKRFGPRAPIIGPPMPGFPSSSWSSRDPMTSAGRMNRAVDEAGGVFELDPVRASGGAR